MEPDLKDGMIMWDIANFESWKVSIVWEIHSCIRLLPIHCYSKQKHFYLHTEAQVCVNIHETLRQYTDCPSKSRLGRGNLKKRAPYVPVAKCCDGHCKSHSWIVWRHRHVPIKLDFHSLFPGKSHINHANSKEREESLLHDISPSYSISISILRTQLRWKMVRGSPPPPPSPRNGENKPFQTIWNAFQLRDDHQPSCHLPYCTMVNCQVTHPERLVFLKRISSKKISEILATTWGLIGLLCPAEVKVLNHHVRH